jgi:hypothetical protein
LEDGEDPSQHDQLSLMGISLFLKWRERERERGVGGTTGDKMKERKKNGYLKSLFKFADKQLLNCLGELL